jgi:parallel beta-helix repeat protein
MKKIFYVIGFVLLVVPVAFYINDYFKKEIIASINKDIEQMPSAAGAALITPCVLPAPTSSLVVNVMTRGATGNGYTDDTGAIQAAINQVAGTGGTVLVPSGIYMINAVTSLQLQSNMTLLMQGAILKAIPNSSGNYQILNIDSVSNVNVNGGTLQGERANHQGTAGEWGMGISIMSASNVVINNVTSTNAWGDGFYIGSASNGPLTGKPSSNILFCSVIADNNRRQGMSIVAVNGMLVKTSNFTNTNGIAPMDGIDIEPNAGNTVNNVQIVNSKIYNNIGSGISVSAVDANIGNSMITNVYIQGNIITNNSIVGGNAIGLVLSNTSGHKILNNIVANNYQDGIDLMSGASNNIVSGNVATNNGTVGNPNNGIGILMYGNSANNLITGNIATGNTKANILDLVGGNAITSNITK